MPSIGKAQGKVFCYSANRLLDNQYCLGVHTYCAERRQKAMQGFGRGDVFTAVRLGRKPKAALTRKYQNRPRFGTHVLKSDGSTVKVRQPRKASAVKVVSRERISEAEWNRLYAPHKVAKVAADLPALVTDYNDK